MDNVVDLRPDQFLRALRDTGDFTAAATHAGLEVTVVTRMCQEDPKFDLTVIECHMEWLEDCVMKQAREHVSNARAIHMKAHKARHPGD